MTILESALEYHRMGFNIIPVNPSIDANFEKKPLIKWLDYQTQKSSEQEIRDWWAKWPNAMIGVVTGKISNLTSFDADTPEAIEKIESLIPESMEIPITLTPKGGKHYHLQFIPNTRNSNNGLIHVRSEGGFIIFPPSRKADGRTYTWACEMPIAGAPIAPVSILEYNALSLSLYARGTSKITELVTDSHIFFGELRKDEDLFHAANIMTKGGAEPQFIYEVLERLILSWGETPDEKWIKAKIKSAMDRFERKERNITDEIREWVQSQPGHFLVTDSHRESHLVTKEEKHAANVAMTRLVEEGIIERYGDKRGSYRLIDRKIEIQDWKKAKGKPLNLEFPLGVGRFVRIFSGNIILLEGQKSQGKSSFAIEFCRLNSDIFKEKILYQNVEMSDDEFLERFESYGDVRTVEEWDKTMTIIRQTDSWWDKVLPDGLNVIDYLVEYKEAFLIAQFIFNIHQKLKNGIAMVVVQRDPFKPYPVGGRGVRDIPRLILSLIHHKIKIEDVKSFKKTEFGNPVGLTRKYKQVSWWNFIGDGEWGREEDVKYADFTKGTVYK